MRKDDWIKAAMTDDTMVAELLMRLNHNNNQYSSSSDSYASSSSLPEKNFDLELPLLFIKWGSRKPRSRLILLRHNNIMNHHHHLQIQRQIQAKKESDLIRASPTTPLSWSPGSSSTLSGGRGSGSDGGSGNCYEESSRPYNWFSKRNCRSKKFSYRPDLISESDVYTPAY